MPATLRPPDHDGIEGSPYPLSRLNPLGQAPEETLSLLIETYENSGLVPYGSWTHQGNPIEGIAELRRRGIANYVQRVLPLMRTGAVQILDAQNGVLSREILYKKLAEANEHPFGSLMRRTCRIGEMDAAIATGSDRTDKSVIEKDFERDAMDEFGLTGQFGEVTYVEAAKDRKSARDHRDNVVRDKMMLIYSPWALQAIAPEDADPYAGSYGFHAFIAPELRQAGLLAIIRGVGYGLH
jgi:hypothetical protein